mmetsp:Transcript_10568/g.26627  ORF Transcript_10568/g.26627 Transcript_10568/m.26627 type:complete len:565 (-) Transcript_10568:103-1797(-)
MSTSDSVPTSPRLGRKAFLDRVKDGTTKVAQQTSRVAQETGRRTRKAAITAAAKSSALKKSVGSSSSKGEGVFGRPLEEITTANMPIPMVVTDCVGFLFRMALETEGLFRVSGHCERMLQLRALYTDPSVTMVFDDEYADDPHTIAALLKNFFASLPNPIFSFEFYQPLLDVFQSSDDPHVLIHIFSKVLRNMDDSRRFMLAFLFKFLNRLSLNVDITKMSPTNLGIVFGPNLVRPEVESARSLLAQDSANICRFMIEHYAEIFTDPVFLNAGTRAEERLGRRRSTTYPPPGGLKTSESDPGLSLPPIYVQQPLSSSQQVFRYRVPPNQQPRRRDPPLRVHNNPSRTPGTPSNVTHTTTSPSHCDPPPSAPLPLAALLTSSSTGTNSAGNNNSSSAGPRLHRMPSPAPIRPRRAPSPLPPGRLSPAAGQPAVVAEPRVPSAPATFFGHQQQVPPSLLRSGEQARAHRRVGAVTGDQMSAAAPPRSPASPPPSAPPYRRKVSPPRAGLDSERAVQHSSPPPSSTFLAAKQRFQSPPPASTSNWKKKLPNKPLPPPPTSSRKDYTL